MCVATHPGLVCLHMIALRNNVIIPDSPSVYHIIVLLKLGMKFCACTTYAAYIQYRYFPCMLHACYTGNYMHATCMIITLILLSCLHLRASSNIHVYKTSYGAIATYGYMYMYIYLCNNYALACIAVLPLSRQQHDMIRKCALIYAFCIPTHTHTHTTPPHAHAVKWPYYHSDYDL